MDTNIIRGKASVTLAVAAYSGTLSVGDITAYVDGGVYWIKPASNSAANATLNINGIGAKNIIMSSGSNVALNEMTAGKWYELVFNSVLDKFELNSLTSGGGTVTSVSGTANRITSSGGATPVIDISAAYVGQTSIVTVGTLTTGATGAGFTVAIGTSTITGVLLGVNGGTGIANTGFTITLSGSLVTTGAFTTTFATGFTGTITLPTATATLYSTQSASITSAQLATSLTDETGTGVAVFSASPTFTGSPLAPTQTSSDNSTKIATTAYVTTAVGAGNIASKLYLSTNFT